MSSAVPPDWHDIDWREHQRWATVGGAPLNYVDVGSGPAVLLVHGLGASWQCWLANVPALAQHRRVIAVDLPGFGHSATQRERISIQGYGRCLDDLCRQLELGSTAVIGNSMGGFIGAEMAIALPQLVDRLVLVSPAIFWGEMRRARPAVHAARMFRATNAWAFARTETAARRERLRWVVLKQAGIARPETIPTDLAWEAIHAAGGEGFTDATLALADYSIRDRLPEVGCPTLVLWGRRDPLVSHRDADELERLIPNVRKVVWDDCGHVAMMEHPERLNALAEEFLAEPAGASSRNGGSPAHTATASS